MDTVLDEGGDVVMDEGSAAEQDDLSTAAALVDALPGCVRVCARHSLALSLSLLELMDMISKT